MSAIGVKDEPGGRQVEVRIQPAVPIVVPVTPAAGFQVPERQVIAVAEVDSLPLPTGAATNAGLAAIFARQTDGTQHAVIDNFPASQSVTGPLTDSQLRAMAVPVSLPSGLATGSKQDTGNTSLASIDTKLTSPIAVTGALTDTQLRATAVPVSNTSLPLPSGASTAAKQDTGNTSLASIDTKLTSPIAITGALTDTQLRATAVPVSNASLPLPSGASTAAKQDTGNVSLASIDTKLTAPIAVADPLTTSANGAWNYSAGVNGTLTVAAGRKIRSILAHSTAGGSFAINGGNAITVPANVGVEINPQGLLVAPVLVFDAGIDMYFVEYVT